jgi:hypothetical protein
MVVYRLTGTEQLIRIEGQIFGDLRSKNFISIMGYDW